MTISETTKLSARLLKSLHVHNKRSGNRIACIIVFATNDGLLKISGNCQENLAASLLKSASEQMSNNSGETVAME